MSGRELQSGSFVTSVSYRSIETAGHIHLREDAGATASAIALGKGVFVFGYLRGLNGRMPPDPSVWHPWRLLLPARDPEGFLVIGSVWRRRVGAAWQYKTRTTSVLAEIYERERPDSLDQWHKWNLLGWPKRSVEGRFLLGRVWRRRRDGKWEYRERPDETDRIPGDW